MPKGGVGLGVARGAVIAAGEVAAPLGAGEVPPGDAAGELLPVCGVEVPDDGKAGVGPVGDATSVGTGVDVGAADRWIYERLSDGTEAPGVPYVDARSVCGRRVTKRRPSLTYAMPTGKYGSFNWSRTAPVSMSKNTTPPPPLTPETVAASV